MADLHEPVVRAEPENELTNADRGIGGADEGVGIRVPERHQDIRALVAAPELGEEPQRYGEIVRGVCGGLSLMRESDALVDDRVEEEGQRPDEDHEQREEGGAPSIPSAKILAHGTPSVK